MPKQPKKTQHKNLVKKTTQTIREVQTERKRTAVHRSFHLSRKSELPELEKLPSSWRLLKRTFAVIFDQKLIVAMLLLLYLIVAWVISGMFALTNFTDIKALVPEGNQLWSINGVQMLIDSFSTAQSVDVNNNQPAVLMLNLFSLFFWLAFIWVARYEIAKKSTSIREALYTSGTSFVPFLLVLAVLFVQCVPGAYGISIIANVSKGTIFNGGLESAAFLLLAFLLIVGSVYFIVSTIIALQIIALPGMYPWKALRSARNLISGRRLNVLRKCIVLFLVLALLWLALFIPTLIVENLICGSESCWAGITILPFMYYFLLALSVTIGSIYLYMTYRSLLEVQED